MFLAFAVAGLFAGLAGRLLAGPLEHPSAVLTGLVIFLNFGAGVLVQTTTTRVPGLDSRRPGSRRSWSG